MIAEIITFDGRKFKLRDHRTTSIKWSDRYGCFLINDSVRVYRKYKIINLWKQINN